MADELPNQHSQQNRDLGAIFYKVRGAENPCGEGYLYHAMDAVDTREIRNMKGSYYWSSKRVGGKQKRVKKLRAETIYLPLNGDSEYQTLSNPDHYGSAFHERVLDRLHAIGRGSIPITVQFQTIRPIEGKEPGVYLHPGYKRAFPRSKSIVREAPEPFIQYLKDLGLKAEFRWCGSASDPSYVATRDQRILRLDIFAHFGVADYLKIWGCEQMRAHLRRMCVGEAPKITQKRQLSFAVPVKKGTFEDTSRWIEVPAMVRIDGKWFCLEVSMIDTGAMGGSISMHDFHLQAGVPMDSKDNYEGSEKGQMAYQFIAACDLEGLRIGAYEGFVAKDDPDLLRAIEKASSYYEGNIFLDYARGDVRSLYQAVVGFGDQFRRIYESLGLGPYARLPRMTIGSSVHDLLQAAVFKRFEGAFDGCPVEKLKVATNFDPKDGSLLKSQRKWIVEHGFDEARAKKLATSAHWVAANARVFGGRVLSTAPTLISRSGTVTCDMDLSGAYAASMMNQLMPIGKPMIDLKFTRNSKRNYYPPLRKYLKDHEHEFVPGLWQLTISLEDPETGEPIELPSDQDYFTSWKTPVIFEKPQEYNDGEWLDRSDLVKVCTREITNAIFTSDSLDWLRHCCSEKLRAFILDNAKVKSALLYPRSLRRKTPKEFVNGWCADEAKGKKNTCKLIIKGGKSKVKSEENEYYGWCAFTISELLTTPLKKQRDYWKQFTKLYETMREDKITSPDDITRLSAQDQKLVKELTFQNARGLQGVLEDAQIYSKHPLDELYKLCSNTVYGDIVSPFFNLSNPCVGNNITSRVRSMIWYFEKACRAWNSITDGGLFDLNVVNFPVRPERRDRLNEKNTIFAATRSKRENRLDGIIGLPLGARDEDPVLEWKWADDQVEVVRESGSVLMPVKEARKLVDKMVLAHTRAMFDHQIEVIQPDFSPFEFESKGLVKRVAIHGGSNYYLQGGSHGSYKKGSDWCLKLRSYPSSIHDRILRPFFEQLIENPESIDRSAYSVPFTLGRVLKVGRFNDANQYFRETILEPGDTELVVKLFREFSPSSLRFRTFRQEAEFLAFHQKHRDVGHPSKSRIGRARGQSIESFYLNRDGTLNYRQMMIDIEAAVRDGQSAIHVDREIESHPSQNIVRAEKLTRLQEVRITTKTANPLKRIPSDDPEVELDWALDHYYA